jgi:hypothetical protein
MLSNQKPKYKFGEMNLSSNITSHDVTKNNLQKKKRCQKTMNLQDWLKLQQERDSKKKEEPTKITVNSKNKCPEEKNKFPIKKKKKSAEKPETTNRIVHQRIVRTFPPVNAIIAKDEIHYHYIGIHSSDYDAYGVLEFRICVRAVVNHNDKWSYVPKQIAGAYSNYVNIALASEWKLVDVPSYIIGYYK